MTLFDNYCSDPEWEWANAFGFGENIIVASRCPLCGRFIKCGESVRENVEYGHVTFGDDWQCSRCGVITPEWTRTA